MKITTKNLRNGKILKTTLERFVFPLKHNPFDLLRAFQLQNFEVFEQIVEKKHFVVFPYRAISAKLGKKKMAGFEPTRLLHVFNEVCLAI